LERLGAPLCTAVSGCVDSQQILETLERQDLFISALDGERRWFRYHHLFRSYLRRRLDRERPGLAASLERAACEWFAADGRTDEAVAHALAAGAEDRAIELVERDAMRLVEHSRMATLLGLIHRLPVRRLVDRPRLQIAIAWSHCLMHHPDDVHRALACVEDSLSRGLGDPDASDELRAETQLVRGTNEIYADRIELVETLVQPCLDHAEEWRPWLAAVAANLLSYRFTHIAQFERARDLQTWARKFHDRTVGPFSSVYGLCFAGMAAAGQGALDIAAAHFQEALEQARAGAGRHSHAARLAAALWGQIQYEHNELEEAEHLLEESRALGAEGGVVDFSLATYVTLARLRAVAGDPAGAHELLDEGLETAHRLRFERLAAALDAERVRLYLQEGAIQRAERVVSPEGEDDECSGVAGIHALVCEYRGLARARIEYTRGDAAAAVARLRKLVAHAHANGRWLAETTLRLPLARALGELGDHDAARTALVAALEAGARQGLVRGFLDENLLPMLIRLRDTVRRDGSVNLLSNVAERHLYRLIAAADTVAEPRVPAAGARRLVEPLTQRELEIVHLLARGCSNKEIARTLGITVNTVKWHLKSLYSKLCVSRRTQAVAEVQRL
ncbi:MAG: LuxR C-terminal-related transcriptional regulator, partial [Salinisphaera sp.]|nr:LuxR C-terminal-related transcriptional regulator [Salinisphaera sp.]